MQQHQTAGMIQLAFSMTSAVECFREHVRQFFYEVMLSGHECPKCAGSLAMIAEGECRCCVCGHEFNPTVAFQRCTACDGRIRLQINADYFRAKMAESRERRRELRERVRQMLAESRSDTVQPEPVTLTSVPGLLEALNALTQGLAAPVALPRNEGFNLSRYQAHVQAHLLPHPIALHEIPPLGEDRRKDLVWRFIAIIFLAHARLIDVWQNGQEIMVRQHETDPERPGVPGDLEEADGIEGSVC
jgi:hypothetical protein